MLLAVADIVRALLVRPPEVVSNTVGRYEIAGKPERKPWYVHRLAQRGGGGLLRVGERVLLCVGGSGEIVTEFSGKVVHENR